MSLKSKIATSCFRKNSTNTLKLLEVAATGGKDGHGLTVGKGQGVAND